MIAALQRIADRLGTLLDRPVAIDDMKIRQLVYTYHPDGNDAARERAILQRHASPEIVRWTSEQRVSERHGAFLLPANPSIGLSLPRWGAVARVDDRGVAFVWVATPDEELDPARQRHIVAAAESVAEVFARQRRFDELRSLREQESLSELLSDDPALRSRAAGRMADGDDFMHDDPVAAIVLLAAAPSGSVPSDRDRAAMAAVLEDARLALSSRQTMGLVRPGHGVLVVARPDATRDRHGTATELAETARARLEQALTVRRPRPVWAGIGVTRAGLADLAGSYREALQAAEVSAALKAPGKTVHYDQLGVYRRIAQLVSDRATDVGLHPGVRLLLDREGAGDHLAETLEVYLDNAGDAVRSAERLHVHRASLYARLRRIEEQTGLDLGNGQDRLVAHLELKIARLQRVRRGAHEDHDPFSAAR
ncbi:PucR family transcriptional regulator [Blastococcus sp. CT_GayMR20]|uniref:PucR family transcriptional regulator n=1 Tax=Blastococcus sp. CT_GayMR20 TaxID=2559609 RepID=UPI0010744304|nr:helix-turn-helix domain-containing protein [Blastococcus sp. CT_GayMR20]TFV91862.1 PucR family transcriptional regulator [Blastococcus sp. CT_GayMR20]TFV91901.1 PucR family transcriptional regulator [Blastococcus sp. CT_GayMR20]